MSSDQLDDLIGAYLTAWPDADPHPVRRAHAAATRWHRGEYRHSGDPYISHPTAVATIVAGLGGDQDLVCAALLHDLPRSVSAMAWLRDAFGTRAADLVRGLADLDEHPAQQRALLRHLADGTTPAADRDVLLLKLADRLHNMRTLRHLPRARRILKSRETVRTMAPLAALLELPDVRHELTTLAMGFLHRPGRTAATLLAASAAALPRTTRERWLHEWTGELAVLPTRAARARFVVQILRAAPRMALTLRARHRT